MKSQPPPLTDSADIAIPDFIANLRTTGNNGFANLLAYNAPSSQYIHNDTVTGITSTMRFDDYLNGYHTVVDNNQFNSDTYDYRQVTDGRTTITTQNVSSVDSQSSYTETTFMPVGNRNGYIQNFNNNTDGFYFVDMNISSFSRTNDVVSFDMGNGTGFQAQTSTSEDDIFKYTTDGINTSYAKLGFNTRDNNFTYADGVTFFGSSDHEDTMKLSTYDRSVDLRGGEYINIDNIDASNTSSTSYYQRNLFGNAGNNKIYAGAGDLLWGGAGDDNLYGGQGNNAYRYCKGDGNDVIYNSVASDKVYLSNFSVEDILSVGYHENNLNINMAGGESLKIVGADAVSNFVLDDSSEWQYHRDTQSISRVK